MKEQDCLRRFVFEGQGIRGEWVRLQQSWVQAKQNQQLSVAVEEQLGQALAASVLLSATIKFDGSLILQAQGEGDLKTIVAQCTHDRKVRGLARANQQLVPGTLLDMMGKGRLVITVESNQNEPYQGIVVLEDDELADAIRRYFMQSEQLPTQLWLFANQTHAAGFFLQQMPDEKQAENDWERIITLANTISKDEMLTLDSEEMIYRLFHQEHVKLFDAEPVVFECACSKRKIEGTLAFLGRNELEAIIKEKGSVVVGCEFCGRQYTFDKVDVEKFLVNQPVQDLSETRH